MSGRPSKYKPEFCEQAIEMGIQGKSVAQMALAFGVSRETLYQWKKEHSEFSDSLACARDYALAFWEDIGFKACTEGLPVNAALYGRIMAARFPDDYCEKRQMELTGKDGKDFIPAPPAGVAELFAGYE